MSAEHIKITQFKQGASGNPKGRPRGIPSLNSQLKEILQVNVTAHDHHGKLAKMSMARVLALALVKSAIRGNVRAIIEILDRTEGKVTQRMGHFGDEGMSFPPVIIQCVGIRPQETTN